MKIIRIVYNTANACWFMALINGIGAITDLEISDNMAKELINFGDFELLPLKPKQKKSLLIWERKPLFTDKYPVNL